MGRPPPHSRVFGGELQNGERGELKYDSGPHINKRTKLRFDAQIAFSSSSFVGIHYFHQITHSYEWGGLSLLPTELSGESAVRSPVLRSPFTERSPIGIQWLRGRLQNFSVAPEQYSSNFLVS